MKKILFPLIFIIFLLVGVNEIKACTCLRTGSLLESADAIFVGKVISENNSKWSVEVSKVVKGKVSEKASIKTEKNADCSWNKFELNQTYVFFLDNTKKNRFEPSDCGPMDTLTNWNTKYRGMNFDFRRKIFQKRGMSEQNIAVFEKKFYEDLADMEKERQYFLKILEDAKAPNKN